MSRRRRCHTLEVAFCRRAVGYLLFISFISPLIAAPPAELQITNIQVLETGETEVAWEGVSGEFYQLEATVRPELGFTPISGAIEGSSKVTHVDPTRGLLRRFYRVVRIDPDAAEYSLRASIQDPTSLRSISHWVAGLKDMGLYDHVVYMNSMVRGQNAGGGSKVFAIKGPTGNVGGTPRWTSSGLSFSADGWVDVPNPFPSGSLSSFSLLTVFDSDQSGPRMIFGSDGSGLGLGPALLAGGSPSQGVAETELFFDYSTDGLTYPTDFGQAGRRTFVRANTGDPEIALATFSPTNISCQSGMDLRFQSAGNHPSAWNGNSLWRIGARLDGLFPFIGTVSLVAAFDVAISESQYHAIRHLYADTIGSSVQIPRINVIIEGDSLSEESVITTWGELLMQEPNWKGKFSKRNVARGGEIVEDMLNEYPREVLPLARQPGKNYLFIWGGAREIRTRTGEEAFADLRHYWAMAREAGFIVVAFTILPFDEPTSPVGPHRQVLNQLIRSATSEYDILIDVNYHPLLQDPHNPYFYRPDGIHLWEAGNQVIADLINQVIPNP